MKVLVATTKTQGQRKNDFCYTDEDELVGFGFQCDCPGGPDNACGCKRAFTGLDSRKATTTAIVEERDMTEEQLRDVMRESLSGWLTHETDYEAEEWVEQDTAELIRIADAFVVGDVIENRGTKVQIRTAVRVAS